MAWIERAMERMYGDINLTDELVDDEAEVLLKWGEAEHIKLAAQSLDEDALDAGAAAVRKVMKRVNGFIGKWQADDPGHADAALAKLVDALGDLGYDVAAAQVQVALVDAGASDKMSALRAVLGLLPAGAPPPTDPAPLNNQTDNPLGAE